MKFRYNLNLFVLSFISFFIALFLVSTFQRNDNLEYEKLYSSEEVIKINTGVLDNFEDLNVLNSQKEKYDLIIKNLKQKIKQKQLEDENKTIINYVFTPEYIEKYLIKSDKYLNISNIIYSKIFKNKNINIKIILTNKKSNIRGTYKNGTIIIYDVVNLSMQEMLGVFIHELGHYFDIEYLKKQVFFDVSDKFYYISWNDLKTLKPGSEKDDFVSGYAMTNKYEDFAESFTYYILSNEDFRTKSENNNKIKEKYNFFSKYIFKNDDFLNTNFKEGKSLSDYSRDTTKINFGVKNFLDYFKK
ncbi:MAG: putative zinc-binding metallopeptidase [Candidatus Gracilibacteria bacterium]|nr:putative zinc-binding metallopeptidase [Candidatus Gracilibacteria bacterium]